ncbi:Tar ligand binding domain-containing protein [Duganella sp. BuS-21]|uniref:Tar ligand binding domain-containing protein n=1 Tax=Duganella sp. BuS-21 TaxID=2943848 RepID=UPI0035A726F7
MLKKLSIRVRLIYFMLSMSLLQIARGICGLVGIAQVNQASAAPHRRTTPQ